MQGFVTSMNITRLIYKHNLMPHTKESISIIAFELIWLSNTAAK